MKKIFLLALLALGLNTAFAQRFAYVDSKYIIENLEEYQTAQAELDAISKRWQQTIEAKYAEIDRLKQAYQAEKILLTEQMKQKRLAEIEELEKEALKYQHDKFGVNGELFKKRQEIVQPIQDRVFEAIQDLAKERSYAVIFDKSVNTNILYSNPKYDKSEEVLRKLGVSSDD